MAGKLIWFFLSTLCVVNAKSLGYEYENSAKLSKALATDTVNIGGHPVGFIAPTLATPSTASPVAADAQFVSSFGASLPTALSNFDGQVSTTLAPTLIPQGPLSFGGELIAHSVGGDLSAYGINGPHVNTLPLTALPFGPYPTGWEAFSTAAPFIGTHSENGILSTPAPSLESVLGFDQQVPIVKTQFYLHTAPEEHNEIATTKHITIGRPQKNYRVVFINAPSTSAAKAHVSVDVAPQEEKTVIYVLSQKQDKINVDGVVSGAQNPLSKPEVFFIKYKTAEEALHAQREIQAQYDTLGGTTQVSDEGVAPLTSVIGSLGPVSDAPFASVLGGAPSLHVLGQTSLASTTIAPIFHTPTTIAPALSALNTFNEAPTTIAPLAASLHLLGQHALPVTTTPNFASLNDVSTIAPVTNFNAFLGQQSLPSTPAPSFLSTTLAPSLAPLHTLATTIAPALSSTSAEPFSIVGQHFLHSSPAFISTTLAPSLASLHTLATTIAPALSSTSAEPLSIVGQHSLHSSPAPALLSTAHPLSLEPLEHTPITAAAELLSPQGHLAETLSSTIAPELFPSSTAASVVPADNTITSTIAPSLSASYENAPLLSTVNPTLSTTWAPTSGPDLSIGSHNIDVTSTNAAFSAATTVSPIEHSGIKSTLPTITYNGAPKVSLFPHVPTTLAPPTSTIGHESFFASEAPKYSTFASYGPPTISALPSHLPAIQPTLPTLPARGAVRFTPKSTTLPFIGSVEPSVSSTFATSTEVAQPIVNSHSLLTSFSFGSGRKFKSLLSTQEPEPATFKKLSNSRLTASPKSEGFKKRHRH